MSDPIVHVGRWQDTIPGTYDPARAVVVTDPPYGLLSSASAANSAPDGKNRGRGQLDTRKGFDTRKGYEDTIPWTEHVVAVLAQLPAKRHVIRGPATTLIRRDYPQPRRICVEMTDHPSRQMTRPGVVPYLWQGWAVYGRLKVERHRQAPAGDALSVRSQLHAQRDDMRRTTHRALTPYVSALWIVDTWVDPGDIVIDPFAGHGTIGRAARLHGFDYIGAEIIPEYAAVAIEGFATDRLTLDLPA